MSISVYEQKWLIYWNGKGIKPGAACIPNPELIGSVRDCCLSAPFRKYLNVFIDPTCGWLRTVAQMRGLAYRSIPFRQAGGAAAYLAGPTDLPPSRRSVSFPDHAPLPTPPPPATHGPFPRAAP